MPYAPDHALIATPIGMVRISGDDDVVTRIHVGGPEPAPEDAGSAKAVLEAVVQLRAYFAGTLRDFDLPLIPFDSKRGETLRAGPSRSAARGRHSSGDTVSYGALARQIGSGPRAIGQACARNPYPLVIPCHRILAAGGRLGAYSAGEGPNTKQWLLDHEARHSGKALSRWEA
jgi:methylated-DNA-[protein]-cysteine S-methyltransferase